MNPQTALSIFYMITILLVVVIIYLFPPEQGRAALALLFLGACFARIHFDR